MTTTTQARPPLNGVDVPTLFATIDAVKAQPEAARGADDNHPGSSSGGRLSNYSGTAEFLTKDERDIIMNTSPLIEHL